MSIFYNKNTEMGSGKLESAGQIPKYGNVKKQQEKINLLHEPLSFCHTLRFKVHIYEAAPMIESGNIFHWFKSGPGGNRLIFLDAVFYPVSVNKILMDDMPEEILESLAIIEIMQETIIPISPPSGCSDLIAEKKIFSALHLSRNGNKESEFVLIGSVLLRRVKRLEEPVLFHRQVSRLHILYPLRHTDSPRARIFFHKFQIRSNVRVYRINTPDPAEEFPCEYYQIVIVCAADGDADFRSECL